MSKHIETRIGQIENFYGGLSIMTADGRFYWSIKRHDGDNWQEIPEKLYDALLEYERERDQAG